jgi:hypothetical protein
MRTPSVNPEQLLQRILRSPAFQGSQHADLLEYVCLETQHGNYDALHEHDIGVTVFGLEPGYDVEENPLVRTLAAEVKEKLANFFRTEGRREPLRLTIPKGEFRAFFYEADPSQIAADDPTPMESLWQPYWQDNGHNVLIHGTVDADAMLIPEAYAAIQVAVLFQQRSCSIQVNPASAFADDPLPPADYVIIGTVETNPVLRRYVSQAPETAFLQRISPADGRGTITIIAAPDPAGLLLASRIATTEVLVEQLLGQLGVESFPPDFRLKLK